MAISLLEIVQKHARRQGLPVPALVFGGSDSALQAAAILDEFCDDLVTRRYWDQNVREATWTSTASESQGALTTLAAFGYEGIVPGTVWDRTTGIALDGSLTPQQWQAQKSATPSGSTTAFRLRNGTFLTIPALPAGHSMAFEYYSSFFVKDGATYKQYWSKDTDVCAVDDALPVAYLRWAWKKDKGFEYAEDFAKYERMLSTKLTRNLVARPVDMSTSVGSMRPGVLVPYGNWAV